MRVIDSEAQRLSAFRDWLPAWFQRQGMRCEPGRAQRADTPHGPHWVVSSDTAGVDTTWVWMCVAGRHPLFGFHAMLARAQFAQARYPGIRAMLASPDDLGDPVLPRVAVLDARHWLAVWARESAWAPGIAQRLSRRLQRLPLGDLQGAQQRLPMLLREAAHFLLAPMLRDASAPVAQGMRVRHTDGVMALRQPRCERSDVCHARSRDMRVVLEAHNGHEPAKASLIHRLWTEMDPWGTACIGVAVARQGFTDHARTVASALGGRRTLLLDEQGVLALLAATVARRLAGSAPGPAARWVARCWAMCPVEPSR